MKMEAMSPAIRRAVEWIDGQAGSLAGTLAKWAEINSGSYHTAGLRHMAEVLTDALAPLGEPVESVEVGPQRVVDALGAEVQIPLGSVLRVRHQVAGAVSVLLNIHYDTVYVPGSGDEACRLTGDGRLVGPGVADAKGGILVMLTAVRALHEAGLDRDLSYEVVLNGDEEVGSPGSSGVLAEAAGRHDVGMVFEPATEEGGMIAERGGSGGFTFVIRGRAAHVGRAFGAGRSAIAAAARLTVGLDELNGRREGVVVNVGRIDGGGPVNIVPDLAIVRVNVRYREPADQEWLESELRRLSAGLRAMEGIVVESRGGFTAPPKVVDEGTRVLQRVVERAAGDLGLGAIEWRATGGVSDGNRLAAAGLVNIDTFGPCGGALHSPEEFVIVKTIAERAKLAAVVLGRMAEGKVDVGAIRGVRARGRLQ